jgi:hypothetical protein
MVLRAPKLALGEGPHTVRATRRSPSLTSISGLSPPHPEGEANTHPDSHLTALSIVLDESRHQGFEARIFWIFSLFCSPAVEKWEQVWIVGKVHIAA